MNINFKILLSALSISVLSTSSMSRGFDIYDNPLLTDSSLATNVVTRLRNTNINDMDNLIKGECNQYKNYIHLSIENWELARLKYKSLNEAEDYSRKLTRQIPYQQSRQYTFPFGIRTYIESEEIIKNAVFTQTEQLKPKEFVDDMYYTCIQMNTQKYLIILGSNEYAKNNQPIFLSESELVKKFDSTNSLLSFKHIPSEEDKLTPPSVGKKIGFTERDLQAVYSLIDDDIKNSFSKSNVRWIDYKKVSRDMQSNFEKFMKEGGRNKNFAVLASLVKYVSLETGNFKNIEIKNSENVGSIFNKKLEDMSEEKFIPILKNFNYQKN